VKKGLGNFITAILALCLLVIMAIMVYAFGSVIDLAPEFHYSIEGVTRFQSCDITLVNLLQTEYPEQNFDFAEAIALKKEGVFDSDIIEQANNMLAKVYVGGNVIFKISDTCAGMGTCVDSSCCSQFVPDLRGNCMEVKIVAPKK